MQPNLPQIKTPYTRYPTYNIKVPSIVDMSLDKLVEQKIREAQYAQQQQAVAMRTPTVLTDPLLNLRVRDYYRQKYDQTVMSEVLGRTYGAVAGATTGAGIGASIGAVIAATLVTAAAILEPTPIGEGAAASLWATIGAATSTFSKVGAGIGAGIGGVAGAIHADYTTAYAARDMFKNMWSADTVGSKVLNSLTFAGRSMDLASSATLIKSTLLSLVTDNNLKDILLNAYGMGEGQQQDVDFSLIREALNLDLGGVGNFILDLTGEMVLDPGNWKNVINLGGNIGHIGRAPYLNPRLKEIKNAVMESTETFINNAKAFSPRAAKGFYKAIANNDPYKMYQYLRKGNSFVGLGDTDVIDTLRKYAKSINSSSYKSLGAKLYGITEDLDKMDDFLTGTFFTVSSPEILGLRTYKFVKGIPFIKNSAMLDGVRRFFKGNGAKFNSFVKNTVKHTIEGTKKMFRGEDYASYTSFKNFLIDIRETENFDTFESTITEYQLKSPQKLLDKLDADPTNTKLISLRDEYKNYVVKKYTELNTEINSLDKKAKVAKEELDTVLKMHPEYTEEELTALSNRYNKESLIDGDKELIEKLGESFIKNYIKLREQFNKAWEEYLTFVAKNNSKIDECANLIKELEEDVEHRARRREVQKEFSTLYKIKRLATATRRSNVSFLKETYRDEFAKAVQTIMEYATSEDKISREIALEALSEGAYKGLADFIKNNMSKAVEEQINLFYNTKGQEFYNHVLKQSPKFKESFNKNMIKQVETLHSKGLVSDEDYQKFLTTKQEKDTDKLFTSIKKIIEDSEFQDKLVEDKRTSFVKTQNQTKQMYAEYRRWESVMSDYGLDKNKGVGTALDIYKKMPSYNFEITDRIQKIKNLDFFDKMFEMLEKSIVEVKTELDEVLDEAVSMFDNNNFKDIYGSYHRLLNDIYFATPEGGSMIRTSKLIYRMATGKYVDEDILTKAFKVVLDKKVMFNKTSGNFNRYEKVYKQLKEYYDNIVSGKIKVKEFYTFETRQKLMKLYNEIQTLTALDIVQFKSATERLEVALQKGIKKLNNKISKTNATMLEEQVKRLEDLSAKFGNAKDLFISVFEYYKGDQLLYIEPKDIIISSLYKNNGLISQLSKYSDELLNGPFENSIELSNKINDVFRKIYNLVSLGNESAPELFKSLRSMFTNIWTDTKIDLNKRIVRAHELLISFGDTIDRVDFIESKHFKVDISISYDSATSTFKIDYTESNYQPFNQFLKAIFNPNTNDILTGTLSEKINKFIETLNKDEEQLKIFKEADPENYNIINSIIKGGTEKEQASRLIKYINDMDIDNKFVDIFQNGRKTSAIIRKSSKYSDFKAASKSLNDHPTVLFDVETTGTESNIAYSLTYSTYENGKWNKHILFTKYNPEWVIDSAVDDLNGGVGSTAKKIMEAKDAEQIFNTPQEMFEYFKTQMPEDTILIAHNARFDYSQIMNSLSGNTLIKEGQVDDDTLEEFAKNNFDYTFVDSQKLVTLFFATGDNINKLTNIEVAKASGLDTILAFKDLRGRITYLYNNKPITPTEFLNKKDNSLLMEFDATTNSVKASYKGGDLHEASTDVGLMEYWSQIYLDNFKEMNLELDDLDESILYQDKLMAKHLELLKQGSIDGYNYQNNIDNVIDMINANYDDGHIIKNNLINLITKIDEAESYDEFYAFLDDLEDYTIRHQDEIEDSLYPLLQDFIGNLTVLDDEFANKVKLIKEMRSGNIVGNFRYNEIATAYRLANNLRNSPSILKFKALFENRQELMSYLEDVNERELAAQMANEPMFDSIRRELANIENSVDWFTKFIDSLDPKYYDLYRNIRKFLEEERTLTTPEAKFRNHLKLEQEVFKRVKDNNLSQFKALELIDEIDSNLDNFRLPDANAISRLYNQVRSNFVDSLNDVRYKYSGNNDPKSVAIVKYIDNITSEIESSFQDLRMPLIEAKQMNRMYRRQGLTLAELNEIAVLKESDLSRFRNDGFDFIADDLEGRFENGIHKLMPWEINKYNSLYTFEYDKNIRSDMSLKRLINQIERNNFVKEESKLYKALPIVDLEHSRLGQLYTLASNVGGFELQDFINSAYHANFLKLSSNYKNIRLVEMCNSLWDSLLTGVVGPEEIGLDPTLFKTFAAELANINEINFSYLKDPGLLKQRLINALMYNAYIKNSEVWNSTEDVLKSHSHISNVAIKGYKYAEQISAMAEMTSSVNANEVADMFLGDFEGFRNYFKSHPELTLVVFDESNMYKQLNTDNKNVFLQFLNNRAELPFSIMSVDDYKTLTSSQKFKLPAPLRWIQKNILTPFKKLALAFSIPFMFKNILSAAYITLATSEAKFDLPTYIKYLGQTIRDNHIYNHIYTSMLTSKTLDDFTHSFHEKEKNWINLIDNPKFMEQLKVENENLYNYITKLSTEDKARLAELNDIVHTSAAYGQINELTKYNEAEQQRERNARDAEEKLKDTKNLTKEEERLYKFQAGMRKYQNMSIDEIKQRLEELDNLKILSSEEHQEKSILESIVKRHNNKRANAIYKWTGIQWFLNVNNNIETVLRTTAMRVYLNEGMTFDQATLKVIETQFTYDNKSIAEQLAEFVVPFASYPIRMGNLALDLVKDGTIMDAVFWSDYYSWDEESEQQSRSEYLTRRRAQGDIPIGSKLLSLANPIQESLFMLQEGKTSLNNKLNPLLKPAVDMVSGSEYVRWNHLPLISQGNNFVNLIQTGSTSFTNDYYRYNQFGNYYLPRVNNRIGGTIYNKLYTKGGYSKISMNMSPLTSSNLKYRVNDILYNSGPKNTRK